MRIRILTLQLCAVFVVAGSCWLLTGSTTVALTAASGMIVVFVAAELIVGGHCDSDDV
jgi:hypothetical protein